MKNIFKALLLGTIASVTVSGVSMAATLHNYPGSAGVTCPPSTTGTSDSSIASSGPSDNNSWMVYLYQLVLHRSPRGGEQNYWLSQLAHGASRLIVVDSFLRSQEYADNTVTALYNFMLNRAPGSGNLSYWSNFIETGNDWTAVESGICGSDEYRAGHLAVGVGNFSDVSSGLTASAWAANPYSSLFTNTNISVSYYNPSMHVALTDRIWFLQVFVNGLTVTQCSATASRMPSSVTYFVNGAPNFGVPMSCNVVFVY